MTTCPACAATCDDADRFCEACGESLRPAPTWLSSAARDGACTHCGGAAISVEGYCDDCGRRHGVLRDRAGLTLTRVAGVTDRGPRRARNEDAIAIGELDAATVAVVCDGVSTSARADEAARAAAEAGVAALLRDLDRGAAPQRATESAYAAARSAVTALGGPTTGSSSPSCTYVSAVGTADGFVVGWVGDSRAYWVPTDGDPVCLTTDDSLAAELAALGTGAGVDAKPHASPLTRWLGADAEDLPAHVRILDHPGPGRLVLCSDGLSRYLGEFGPVGAEEPMAAARRLTQFAIDAGGVDNIAVVVLPYPPDEPVEPR